MTPMIDFLWIVLVVLAVAYLTLRLISEYLTVFRHIEKNRNDISEVLNSIGESLEEINNHIMTSIEKLNASVEAANTALTKLQTSVDAVLARPVINDVEVLASAAAVQAVADGVSAQADRLAPPSPPSPTP